MAKLFLIRKQEFITKNTSAKIDLLRTMKVSMYVEAKVCCKMFSFHEITSTITQMSKPSKCLKFPLKFLHRYVVQAVLTKPVYMYG